MALSDAKIKGLIELARRGIDGERATAQAILKGHGISWEAKTTFKESVKQAFGGNIIKRYRIEIDTIHDLSLIAALIAYYNVECKTIDQVGDHFEILCTESQMKAIAGAQKALKAQYCSFMNRMAAMFVNTVMDDLKNR